jgi:CheY-like chemotaxis protein
VQGELVTVLVVEDDDPVRALVKEALSEGGFQSVVVPSGEEAIALFQRDANKYRALVTDKRSPSRGAR